MSVQRGPTERRRSEGTRRRRAKPGAGPFWLLFRLLEKVTRCKSGTNMCTATETDLFPVYVSPMTRGIGPDLWGGSVHAGDAGSPFRPYGGSLSKSAKVTKALLLLAWPSFVGSPHSGDAPWARRHPPSMAGGGSRGIPAARPTPHRLRSACTQVAICIV